MDKYSIFKNKKIVMFQGPVGPFFKNLSKLLIEKYSTDVTKINFNGGDLFYYSDGMNFTGEISELGEFLKHNLQGGVDFFVLFGDCRKHHIEAKKFALQNGIGIVVFEEGYLRPNYITMEVNGVNANSHIPKDKAFFKEVSHYDEPIHDIALKNWHIGLKIVFYAFFSFLFKPLFRHYKHHRSFGIKSGFKFLKAWTRRRIEADEDEFEYEMFLTNKRGKTFFVPMQVSTDAQVLCHSSINKMEDFVEDVLRAFKKHSHYNDRILFKDHPLEIEQDYKEMVIRISKKIGLDYGVFFVRMVNVANVIDNVDGIITINSTVGLSALLHNKPVFAVGEAIYKFDGMAVGGDLLNFFINPKKHSPDPAVAIGFKNYLLKTNQISGSFYPIRPKNLVLQGGNG